MTEVEALRVWEEILGILDITCGDTVYLGIDMGRIPLPRYNATLDRNAMRAREQRWCQFLLNVLADAIGPQGTLLAPTFSYAYAREGTPYHHESSPSEAGPMTEYFRSQPETVRSFHPLNSISGLGPNARPILEDVGKAGYGCMSPFSRLRAYRTKFLCLGVPIGISLTHAHHLEHMYGVNHMYHKIYTTPTYRNGKPESGPWLCFVRYLGGAGVEPRIGNLEGRLRGLGLIKETHFLGQPMQSVRVDDVEDVGYAMLSENPCAFLAEELEVHVQAPGAAPQAPCSRAVHLVIQT